MDEGNESERLINASSDQIQENVKNIAAGDKTALLGLMHTICPSGWEGVTLDDIDATPLTGGMSGAALWKVSAPPIPRVDPPAVVVRVSGGANATDPLGQLMADTSNPDLPSDALRAWSHGGLGRGVTEQVFCVKNPQFPQLTVTEFIAGETGSQMLVDGPDAVQYAKEMGSAVAWLHQQDTKWFDEGAGETEVADAVKSVGPAGELLRIANYARNGKGLLDTLVCAVMTEGTAEGVEGVGERLYALLQPDSLMGRLVVGHGDLKVANVMVRESSTAADPKVVIIDFDRVMRMMAGIDLGCYIVKTPESKVYPTFEVRRALASGYIQACRVAGVPEAAAADVDDVVFDMEVGLLLRMLWISTIVTTLSSWLGFMRETIRETCVRAERKLTEAKTNPELRKQILEKGVLEVVGKLAVLPTMLQALCCGCCCS